VGVKLTSTGTAFGVPLLRIGVADDLRGIRVGVGVKLLVGTDGEVGVEPGVAGVGGRYVGLGNSGVGVKYSPHRLGRGAHDANSKPAMNATQLTRLTGAPSVGLYLWGVSIRSRNDGQKLGALIA
jgi:hypothetical protein